MRVSYKFNSTLVSKWLPKTERGLDAGVLQMATDIHRRSAIAAPKDTRNLVNSGNIKRNSLANYSIRYGGAKVPYARIQHEGGVIRPKTAKMLSWERNGIRYFARSVTIKGTKYLEKAGESVTRGNVYKYFKGL